MSRNRARASLYIFQGPGEEVYARQTCFVWKPSCGGCHYAPFLCRVIDGDNRVKCARVPSLRLWKSHHRGTRRRSSKFVMVPEFISCENHFVASRLVPGRDLM